MRLIASGTAKEFWEKHPATKSSLERWVAVIEDSSFETMAEVQATFPKAKVLNAVRARFEIGGGDYRLIASFKLKNQIAWIKFIGTHAEYDEIDALTVAIY